MKKIFKKIRKWFTRVPKTYSPRSSVCITHNMTYGIQYHGDNFFYPELITESNDILEFRENVNSSLHRLGLRCLHESICAIDEIIPFSMYTSIISNFERMFSTNYKIRNHFYIIKDLALIICALDGTKNPIRFIIAENKPNGLVVILMLVLRRHIRYNEIAIQYYIATCSV